MRQSYFVYILTNHTNTVLYTGITNNLSRRTFEHKRGFNMQSFTNKYKLYKVIWFQEFQKPEEAISIEKKIKGWRREKKIKLIKEVNPLYQNLLV